MHDFSVLIFEILLFTFFWVREIWNYLCCMFCEKHHDLVDKRLTCLIFPVHGFIGCLSFWGVLVWSIWPAKFRAWFVEIHFKKFPAISASVWASLWKTLILFSALRSQGEYMLFSIWKSTGDFQSRVWQTNTVTRKAFGLRSAEEQEDLSVNIGLPPGARRVGAACLGFS